MRRASSAAFARSSTGSSSRSSSSGAHSWASRTRSRAFFSFSLASAFSAASPCGCALPFATWARASSSSISNGRRAGLYLRPVSGEPETMTPTDLTSMIVPPQATVAQNVADGRNGTTSGALCIRMYRTLGSSSSYILTKKRSAAKLALKSRTMP
jgi:hypothetical protein